MSSIKEQLKGFFRDNGINFNSVKINDKPYPFDNNIFVKKDFIGSSLNPVYSYEHKPTKKNIAGKLIRLPSDNAIMEKKFKHISREIKLHQDLLNFPHIVDFFGVCFEKDELIILMEKMDMTLKSLYAMVHRDYHYFPEKLLGCIAVALVNVGAYCKEKNIMHRDLKPQNILVNKSGEIKLCDFGESCQLVNSEALSRVGTIQYWPPEHFNLNAAEAPYNVTVDIWSLGIILLELIKGEFPIDFSLSMRIIQHEIRNLKATEFITEFFKNNGQFYFTNHAKAFIIRCLQSVENRPQFKQLKGIGLYQTYNEPDLTFAIKKELELIHNKQYFCSTCSKQLSGWEQWCTHFEIKHPNNLREFSSLPTYMPSTSRGASSGAIPPDPKPNFNTAPTKQNILNVVSMANTNTNSSGFPKRCDSCSITSTSKEEWEIHIKGKKHIKNSGAMSLGVSSNTGAQDKQVSNGGPSSIKLKSEFYCTICHKDCENSGAYNSHIAGAKHKKKENNEAKSNS